MRNRFRLVLSAIAFLILAIPGAAGAQTAESGDAEANRLFVEAVTLYRQVETLPEEERQDALAHVREMFDQILAEYPGTRPAEAIGQGGSPGGVDLAALPSAERTAGADAATKVASSEAVIRVPGYERVPRFRQTDVLDERLYVSPDWAQAVVGGKERYRTTCLAVVYAMIEHARGRTSYRVGAPGTWDDNLGALDAFGVQHERDLPPDMDTIRRELTAGSPVILQGYSEALEDGHFMLAVGLDGDVIAALDPLTGREIGIPSDTMTATIRQSNGTFLAYRIRSIRTLYVRLEAEGGDPAPSSVSQNAASPLPQDIEDPSGAGSGAEAAPGAAASGAGQADGASISTSPAAAAPTSAPAEWGPGIVVPETFSPQEGECSDEADGEECLRAHGLSADAIAFSLSQHRRFDGLIFATEFRELGQVDLAQTATDRSVWPAFLNGGNDPGAITYPKGFEDARFLDEASRSFLKRNDVAFYPTRVFAAGHRVLPDGRQRFVVAYPLLVCRACDVLGLALAAVEFDRTGRLLGERAIGIADGPFGLMGNVTSNRDIMPDIIALRRRMDMLQYALDLRGYAAGPMDGIFGSQSQKALLEFQAEHCLQTTGRPDDATLQALAAADGFTAPCAGAADPGPTVVENAAAEVDALIRLGSWSGPVTQPSSRKSYSMRVSHNGQQIIVDYPELSCGGYWEPVSASDGEAKYREIITRGTKNCINGGIASLMALAEDRVSFEWHRSGKSSREGWATLVRDSLPASTATTASKGSGEATSRSAVRAPNAAEVDALLKSFEDGSAPIENLADFIVLDQTGFINALSSGRQIRITADDIGFSGGKVLLKSTQETTDFYKDIRDAARQANLSGMSGAGQLFSLSQDPPPIFGSTQRFQVVCRLDIADAGGIRVGDTVVLHATLQEFSGASASVPVVFDCSIQGRTDFVQEKLNSLGYAAGPMDGTFGSQTQKALLEFQAEHCLQTTGQPDDATLQALAAADGFTAPCAGAADPGPTVVENAAAGGDALIRSGLRSGPEADDVNLETHSSPMPVLSDEIPLLRGAYVTETKICQATSETERYENWEKIRVIGDNLTRSFETECSILRAETMDGLTGIQATCDGEGMTSDVTWTWAIQADDRFVEYGNKWEKVWTRCASDSPLAQFHADETEQGDPSASPRDWTSAIAFDGDIKGIPCDYDMTESCMRGLGFGEEAIRFALRLKTSGAAGLHASHFHELGKVDFAILETYTNYAPSEYFINTSPEDISAPPYRSGWLREVASGDLVAQRLALQYPGSSSWFNRIAGHRRMPSGHQRFALESIFTESCHACPIIGSTIVLVEFDASGRQVAADFMGMLDRRDLGERSYSRDFTAAEIARTPRLVQYMLNSRGYAAGAMDGRIGSTTQTALAEFQRERGINAGTGILDPETLAALADTESYYRNGTAPASQEPPAPVDSDPSAPDARQVYFDTYRQIGGDAIVADLVAATGGLSAARQKALLAEYVIRIADAAETLSPTQQASILLAFLDEIAGKAGRTGEVFEVLNYARNIHQGVPPAWESVVAPGSGWIEAKASEKEFHVIGVGDPDNVRKFIHPDGREAVFLKKASGGWEPLLDGRNDATFNYVPNGTRAGFVDEFQHMALDVAPWLIWGIGPDDRENIAMRLALFENSAMMQRLRLVATPAAASFDSVSDGLHIVNGYVVSPILESFLEAALTHYGGSVSEATVLDLWNDLALKRIDPAAPAKGLASGVALDLLFEALKQSILPAYSNPYAREAVEWQLVHLKIGTSAAIASATAGGSPYPALASALVDETFYTGGKVMEVVGVYRETSNIYEDLSKRLAEDFETEQTYRVAARASEGGLTGYEEAASRLETQKTQTIGVMETAGVKYATELYAAVDALENAWLGLATGDSTTERITDQIDAFTGAVRGMRLMDPNLFLGYKDTAILMLKARGLIEPLSSFPTMAAWL